MLMKGRGAGRGESWQSTEFAGRQPARTPGRPQGRRCVHVTWACYVHSTHTPQQPQQPVLPKCRPALDAPMPPSAHSAPGQPTVPPHWLTLAVGSCMPALPCHPAGRSSAPARSLPDRATQLPRAAARIKERDAQGEVSHRVQATQQWWGLGGQGRAWLGWPGKTRPARRHVQVSQGSCCHVQVSRAHAWEG